MQIKRTPMLFFRWKALSTLLVKTLLLLCCTTVFSFSSKTLYSQNENVVIDTDSVMTIYKVLELIGKQTKCTFIYQSDIFKDVPDVTIKKGKIKVKALLQHCLPKDKFNISITKAHYITISKREPQPGHQDKAAINGIITDENGMPIPGVLVSVEGSTTATTSDFDGSYTIMAPADATLKFSLLGYQTQTIAINGQTQMNVILLEDVTQLDAVTLNAGYYSVKERESTGSIVKIGEHEIEQQPISNPLAALQGRVSGVEIVQTSGVSGAGFDIKIRGQNSIRTNGNDPLYVIDGVPYASSSLGEQQASISIPGSGISPLNNINPLDIERIEILKDADATAIYGSRGANGVVLITTKKGEYGATKVRLNLQSGLGAVTNSLDVLSTPQYLSMRREAYANDGIDPIPFNAYDINGTWDATRETDWQKVLFGKTATLSNFQGSISGGNQQTRFLISANTHKQTSVFPGDYSNQKLSGLASLNHRSENDKLSLQFSTNYTSNQNNLPGDGLIVFNALTLAPNAPELYNDDGSLNWENSTWSNPLSRFEGGYNANGSTLISNLNLSYQLIGQFKLVSNLGYTEDHLNELNTTPSTIYDPAFGVGSESSLAVHNTSQRTSWIVEPQLHWSKAWDVLNIEALAGATFQERNTSRISQFALGFSNNNFIENLSAASTLFPIADIDERYRYQAVFGRLNLNYKSRYILNFTGRRDGSSRFGTNRRFSNFGAVGAAWIFSEEAFVEQALPFISFGKFKASYGTSGNDQIGDYQYLDTYSFGSSQYQNTVGLFPTRLFNPDYSWESNKKLEFSLDLGFLKDRIVVGTNFYRNRSSNQLVGIPLPATTGFNSINANLNATVENTGWEFSLNSVNIDTAHFKWSTSINLTLPKNKLVAFPNLEGSTYANQLVIGAPINIRKVYQLNGVNPETGIYEFEDFDGDGVISSPNDRQAVADLNPKYFGGVSNNITYKNLSLDILFQFTKQLGANFWSSGGVLPGGMANQPIEVLDRWQTAGDQSATQGFSSGLDPEALQAFRTYTQSDAAITDASYLRLKTVSLSYQIPQLSKNFGCELFLRGQNLWTITNYIGLDPETRNNQTVPPLRVISVGTNLTF